MTHCRRARLLAVCFVVGAAVPAAAQNADGSPDKTSQVGSSSSVGALAGIAPSAAPPVDPSPVLPATPKSAPVESGGVEWRKLEGDAVLFLGIMHGFRWATEPGTRAGGIGLGSAYSRSVGNLHGWADGDPFYVNYVGHPMQGAVSGHLFLLNDRRHNRIEFGQSREYWDGKLRAAAFAWALSEQFEIGPLSEASIGHIQKDFPQQGFVDHVVTPSVGLAWMIGEDAIDRYVIKPLEGRTANKWTRIALRTALNPSRTFANIVDRRAPWDRTTRDGVTHYSPEGGGSLHLPDSIDPAIQKDGPARFEFTVAPGWRQFESGPCMGGGADAAWRALPDLEFALAVNGCKLLGLPQNLSGDALLYQVGPRWTPSSTGKWSPYAHLLIGGMKITHEQLYPLKKAAVLEANQNLDPMLAYTLHDQYTRQEEADGVALSIGTGVDYRLNAGLALRVAGVEYLRSSIGRVGGMSYANGLQFTTGMVLRLGTR